MLKMQINTTKRMKTNRTKNRNKKFDLIDVQLNNNFEKEEKPKATAISRNLPPKHPETNLSLEKQRGAKF